MDKDENEIIYQILLFANSPTFDDAKHFLEEHPELLELETDRVDAAWLILQVIEQDKARQSSQEIEEESEEDEEENDGTIFRIRLFNALLNRCREVGIEQAFTEVNELMDDKPTPTDRRSRDVGGPSRFESDIAEMQQLQGQMRHDPQAPEKLIIVYQRILNQLQPEENQQFYTAIQTNLGTAYVDLTTGKREENLVRAIACYQEALRFWTPETAPDEYTIVQFNLGRVYDSMLTGNREENLVHAIACYQEVLRFWTSETAPEDYSKAQSHLGNAYVDLPTGNRGENIALAMACYQESLRFCSPETDPFDYANIHNSLGLVYTFMLIGNKGENLIRAITHYQEALRFYTPEFAPRNYAMTQNNLGVAYSDLRIGDRKENLARAIACHQEALRFWTPETDPFNYAMAQYNLGMEYREQGNLQKRNQEENLVRSIACYQETLRFWTPEISPLDYASIQNGLGLTYAELQKDDRGENLVRAIACYQEALRFWTPEVAHHEYAMAQNNLGRAYARLLTGNREENVNHAIACYQEALRFHTPEISPGECRGTNNNLGSLYFAQRNWASALTAYKAAIDAGEQAYRAGLSTEGKEEEITQNEEFYRHAAFAAAQLGNTVEALLLLERGKTRLLTEALQLHIPRPTNVPDSVWNAFEQAGAKLRTLQSEDASPSRREHNLLYTFSSRQQMAHDATLALNLSIERVRAYAPGFLQEPDIQVFQNLLDDEQIAIVAFCITNQGTIGFVMHRALHNVVQMVEVPSFTLTDLDKLSLDWANSYFRSIRNPAPYVFNSWLAAIPRLLTDIGKNFLSAILAILPANSERIVFIPSGGLFLLPLHAVTLAVGSSVPLCNRYQISYAPSIKVMVDNQAKAKRMNGHSLCAIINPEEDPHLLFTSNEGIAIANLFTESEIYKGQAGTKATVIAGIHKHAYVHFSCHGSYDWGTPLTSGLLLADGRLTLADLQGGEVDMSVNRLVTLSACETGISDILQGRPEEYVGIPAGFMLAGAPCIVASLWAVPELSTAMLMERFYQNHLRRGMSFAAALREAQTWVRELSIEDVAQYAERAYHQSRKEDTSELFRHMRHYRYLAQQNPASCPFAHPYYWAAFTCTGV